MEEWRRVTSEEFDEALNSQKYLTSHTVMICDPPTTFFWNKKNQGESWAFGEHSFAKRINEYKIVRQDPDGSCETEELPEFYLRNE